MRNNDKEKNPNKGWIEVRILDVVAFGVACFAVGVSIAVLVCKIMLGS